MSVLRGELHLAQTYLHWELIIINDGSTDNTLDIAQQFSKNEPRIRVINQKNQGVSAARNKGIQEALGEYISFIDSDDTYHPNRLSLFMQEAKKSQAQFIYCSLLNEKDSTLVPVVFSNKILLDIYTNNQSIISIVSIQFKKELITNIHFDTTETIGEDQLFVIEALLAAKNNVSYVPETLYFYRCNENSTLNTMNFNKYISLSSTYNKSHQCILRHYEGEEKEKVSQRFESLRQRSLTFLHKPFKELLIKKKFDHAEKILNRIGKFPYYVKYSSIYNSNNQKLWHLFSFIKNIAL